MKDLIAFVVVISAITGCASWTPQQKAAATTAMDFGVNLTQRVVDIGIQVIATRATSGSDLNAKANLLDSAAGGLRSLETSSGGLLSAAVVADTLRQFTDPDKEHWSDFADSVAAAIVKDPAPTNQKLEAAAAAANALAASQRAAVIAVSADPDSLVPPPTSGCIKVPAVFDAIGVLSPSIGKDDKMGISVTDSQP